VGQFVASLQRNVAQMSTREVARHQSHDEKRRDGASFDGLREALSDHVPVKPDYPGSLLSHPGAAFLAAALA